MRSVVRVTRYLSHSAFDEADQFLPLLGHGGVEAGLHVLREEFEDESALLVVAHRAAAGLEFVHKLIGQRAVTGAGFGELFLICS